MGLDLLRKQKQYQPSPRTTNQVSHIASHLHQCSGTPLNPQVHTFPTSHTACQTGPGSLVTSAPPQNGFNWAPLIVPAPLLVYSLLFHRSNVLHNKVIFIQWFQKSSQTELWCWVFVLWRQIVNHLYSSKPPTLENMMLNVTVLYVTEEADRSLCLRF